MVKIVDYFDSTESRIDKALRLGKVLYCGHCRPHRGENRNGRKAWHRWEQIYGKKTSYKFFSWKIKSKNAKQWA